MEYPPCDVLPLPRCGFSLDNQRLDQSSTSFELSYFIVLPTCLANTGNLAFKRELPETDSAEAELAIITSRTATDVATVVL
jgi:hypothetical protein